MKAFNEFYYSFSPRVAELTASNPLLSVGVRTLIYPLIGSLHAAASVFQGLRHLSLDLAVLLSGILASCLIGITYVSPIVLLRTFLKRGQKALGGR